MANEKALIVLDRDGVINHDSDEFVKSPAEWRAIEGSADAIAALNRAGFRVVVATNQSGVGRALFDAATLRSIHRQMIEQLAHAGARLDGIYVCPHHPEAGCDCRKPLPGMLRQIERDFGVPMAGVPVVGDSSRDLEAARAVGARPILVLTGKGEQTRSKEPTVECYADLAAAAAQLIEAKAEHP